MITRGQSWLRRVARRRPDDPRYHRSAQCRSCVARQLVASVSRRHAHGAAAAGPEPARRGRRSQRREVREGHVLHVDRRHARTGEPGDRSATLPTPQDRNFCALGTFGPHNLHENRPGSLRSEDTIFATYNNAGVRVFDIRDAFAPKEIAYWVPPTPAQAHRSAAQRGAGGEVGRCLRDDRRPDVRHATGTPACTFCSTKGRPHP